jgi:hypothetical protein
MAHAQIAAGDSLKIGDHVVSKVPVGDENDGRRFDVAAESLERVAA